MRITRPIAHSSVAAILFSATVLSATMLCAPVTALADGPAWWDPLNIAGSATPTRSTARKPAAKDSSWFKLPGFGTDSSKSAKRPTTRKSSEPSTLTKMNNSTKKFFSNAKDAVTFGGDKKKTSTRPTGYGASGSEKSLSRGAKKESSGNILTSWWKTEEPAPKRPRTVPDFISGERP